MADSAVTAVPDGTDTDPGTEAGSPGIGWRLVVAVVIGLAGWGFGVGFAHIPVSSAPRTFWLGNLAAPWIVLPFVAGLVQRRVIWAALGGAVACAASVYGFYGHNFDSHFQASSGYFMSLARWAAVAVPVGIVYGLVGAWWVRSRSLIAAILVAGPFVAEPLLQTVRVGYVPMPYVAWIAEIVVGVAGFALLASRRRAR